MAEIKGLINVLCIFKDIATKERHYKQTLMEKEILESYDTFFSSSVITLTYNFEFVLYNERCLIGRQADIIMYDDRLAGHIAEFCEHSKMPPQEIKI